MCPQLMILCSLSNNQNQNQNMTQSTISQFSTKTINYPYMLVPFPLFFFPSIPLSAINSLNYHFSYSPKYLHSYMYKPSVNLFSESPVLMQYTSRISNYILLYVHSCNVRLYHMLKVPQNQDTCFVLSLCSHCWRQCLAYSRYLAPAIVKWAECMNGKSLHVYHAKEFLEWIPLSFLLLLLFLDFLKVCCLNFIVSKLMHDQSKEKRCKE